MPFCVTEKRNEGDAIRVGRGDESNRARSRKFPGERRHSAVRRHGRRGSTPDPKCGFTIHKLLDGAGRRENCGGEWMIGVEW
jgi:hypothetical protein